MVESFCHGEESCNLSFEDNQKEMCRLIIMMRTISNLTIKELADRVKMDAMKLNEIELGNSKINVQDFMKIIEECGVWGFLEHSRK